MRISRLYLDATLKANACITLSKEQAHYALTVLRLKNGSVIEAFDGKGTLAHGTLEHTSRRSADFVIQTLEHVDNESPLNTVLVQGISRGDRMDQSIQKAVELGVSAIQPVFTERCEVKLKGDKLEKRRQQWQTIAINACEQSGRNVLPEILPIMSLEEWLTEQTSCFGLVLDPYASNHLSHLKPPPLSAAIHLFVGPEGGLTAEEVDKITANGAIPVQLGPRVLRTETAGPAILAILQTLWGDFA